MDPRSGVRSVSDLGANVAQRRKDDGLTQQQLADRAHVSRRWLGMLENGQNLGADFTRVLQVLRALDLELHLADAPEPGDDEKELLALLEQGI